MQIRRVLLLASMVVLLWAAPAAAQSYGGILPSDQTVEQERPAGVNVVNVHATSFDNGVQTAAEGDLARTGADNVVPLIQAAIVLMGGGFLLLLVARRRHGQQSATA